MDLKSSLNYYEAYFECMFWFDINNDTEGYNDMLGYHSIERSSMVRTIKELDEFFKQAGDILDMTDYTDDLACYDFYLTRCGHGCGFWENDHCNEEQGKLLTDIANSFGTVDIIIDGDIIYL